MSPQPQNDRAQGVDEAVLVRALDETSLREVRHLVRVLLDGRAGVAVDDAVLVTDELVSNARRHGEPPRTCRLALVDEARRLRVEVDDTSAEEPRIRTPDESGGRGLVIVDTLAEAWGVRHHPGGKTVWAEVVLDRPGGGRAPHLSSAATWAERP
ncbi:ATP-binding protein [Saccharothrix syringae]|uniref:ATP-binding protein n=1 Tax=Saccharothrix syringae TaxID=103733 RepID=UPI0014778743|nr:ATP-binding protein [Saccharothrix syringae]